MFNPEKLLGSMLKSTLKGGKKLSKSSMAGLGGLGVSKGALAMGALGVAIAAYDHFTEKNQQTAGTYPQPGNTPPPVLHGAQTASVSTGSMPPPPPRAVQSAPISNRQEEAVLLIQAMIASANADGVLDAEERKSILEKLNEGDLSLEEKSFISEAFLSPPSMEDIIKKVNTPVLAQQVYAVSLLTVTVDTEEERNYLNSLAKKLYLDEKMVSEIHEQVGMN